MLRTRIIPCLQLLDEALVKTVKFKKPQYIGDFVNTARIFNELEVDEMCIQSIRASKRKSTPNFKILEQMANECFMPLSYGGGINSFDMAKNIFEMGYEKVLINSAAFRNADLISKISSHYGAQSVIASIDVKKGFFGAYQVYSIGGTQKEKTDPIAWAKHVESVGAGEILLTSMDRDGTWMGFDTSLVKAVSDAVGIPVIASGGAGALEHIGEVVKVGSASAVALGSMLVYQNKGMGVLVNFPDKAVLTEVLS